jgi:hypothetical protein
MVSIFILPPSDDSFVFVGQRVEQPICHGSEGRQLFEIA